MLAEQKGNIDAALADYKKALEIKPSSEVALRRLFEMIAERKQLAAMGGRGGGSPTKEIPRVVFAEARLISSISLGSTASMNVRSLVSAIESR